MDIRRLQPTDAEPYRALRLRALREHPEAFTSSFEEDSQEPVAASQKRLEGKVRMWGAFVDGALVGIVGLDPEARLKNRHKAHVVGMYVAPEAGRRGVGRALMDALLADARASGFELLVLTVTAGNDGARDLYVRCGFKTFGIEPGAIKVDGRAYDKDHMALPLAVQAA
jgi:ribosomal protein S18 acetylase RimI-like enzyme